MFGGLTQPGRLKPHKGGGQMDQRHPPFQKQPWASDASVVLPEEWDATVICQEGWKMVGDPVWAQHSTRAVQRPL